MLAIRRFTRGTMFTDAVSSGVCWRYVVLHVARCSRMQYRVAYVGDTSFYTWHDVHGCNIEWRMLAIRRFTWGTLFSDEISSGVCWRYVVLPGARWLAMKSLVAYVGDTFSSSEISGGVT